MPEKILSEIHNQLLSQKKTIAVAESCTGGLLCVELTKNPGASAYFLLGVVAYSNNSKNKILQIPAKFISRYGAVSRQIAISMAENIRKKTKADLGISITGIAGPGGSTVNKPVGTVFICLSAKKKNTCRLFYLRGNRRDIRNKATQEALRLLCAHLSL
ncbi:MAG: CinA family protein [Candidatus Omnitrophica bacterium]|nr:CinA family protein [Candidatus Omnitrophota bacterium]